MGRNRKTEQMLMAVITTLSVILILVLALVVRKELPLRRIGHTDTEKKVSEQLDDTETAIQIVVETDQALETVAENETVLQPIPGIVEGENELQEPEDAVRSIIDAMSLEEKVCQLFVITPEALTGVEPVTMAGEVTKQAYQSMPVGGIVLMEQNLTSPEELQIMTQNLHIYSQERIGVPVLISIDEEGGTVARIGNHGNFNVPYIGNMSETGASEDPEQAYLIGTQLGSYLSSYGIDVDYAPVADVWWNRQNTVVAQRSFGSNPELVAQMVEKEVAALQENSVSATLKHFPGHGGTSGDSHNGFVYIDETMDVMWNSDLLPFQRGIDAGVDCIMVGHICTPQIDGGDVPATLSHYWVTEVLRNTMGFQGIIITDALNMGAITESYTSADACIMAVEAGVDMLLMPSDFQSAYQGILDAVVSGRISEERLNESVERIVRLKYRKR